VEKVGQKKRKGKGKESEEESEEEGRERGREEESQEERKRMRKRRVLTVRLVIFITFLGQSSKSPVANSKTILHMSIVGPHFWPKITSGPCLYVI
jgi:hypothetical protein